MIWLTILNGHSNCYNKNWSRDLVVGVRGWLEGFRKVVQGERDRTLDWQHSGGAGEWVTAVRLAHLLAISQGIEECKKKHLPLCSWYFVKSYLCNPALSKECINLHPNNCFLMLIVREHQILQMLLSHETISDTIGHMPSAFLCWVMFNEITCYPCLCPEILSYRLCS